MQKFGAVQTVWAQITEGKGVFGPFFYVEANVRISYIGTLFEAMVLKLCTGYLVHITKYV